MFWVGVGGSYSIGETALASAGMRRLGRPKAMAVAILAESQKLFKNHMGI